MSLRCAVTVRWRAGLPPAVREAPERLARPGGKVLLGPRRRWGTSGTLVHPWNIVENVPRGVLAENGTERRRKVRHATPSIGRR